MPSRGDALDYAAVIESSPDPIALLDRDGTIRFISGSIERLSGYTADELVGRSAFELVHPEDLADVRDAFSQVLERPGVPLLVEYRARHKNGRSCYREMMGLNQLDAPDIGAIVINYRDTTIRNLAELAILERERIYQSMFHEALIGIAQTSLSGKLLLVNQYLCDRLGYTAAELATKDVMSISHPDDVAQDSLAKTQLIAGTLPRYSREKRYRRKDGSFMCAHLTVSLHRDIAGQPSYFIAIIQDISDRKRAADEREDLERRLRQAQKMEAIGQLAGGVAHDFNNLLTVIRGCADLVLTTLTPDDPRRVDVDQIITAADGAASLTRQLLAFSRKQVLQPTVLDLNTLVAKTARMLRRLIGEDVELVTNLEPSLTPVHADAGQLEQILINLAVNARDAMPQGGRLSIETANVTLGELVVQHPVTRRGPYVMLAVSDTGVGMTEQTKQRIFEPFFTTKDRGSGTGLGLATVYGIVKQSGGDIWVYSELGQGSTFKVYLPRADSAEITDLPPVKVGAVPSPVGSETVLLVEDESAVRLLSHALLERAGYRVLDAGSPEEAEKQFCQHAAAIDLLLTDVIMPGSSGPSLFKRLSALRPQLRVLYMSGYTDNALVHHCGLAPGIVFLQKPFTADALRRKVREALDR